MLTDFKNHLNNSFSFLNNKELLLAISGGIDSVVLLFLLKKLNYNIYLAHCNFHLRGIESDEDEQFVRNLAALFNIKLFVKHFDTKQVAEKEKISIQMAARELRYAWFNQVLKEQQLDYLITAHQQDDVVETFLINFTRGTGLSGLTGIAEVNGHVIRPLLPFPRNKIHQYAKENNISWREDSSNASTKYFRNKIRHKIMPILKELNPNFMNSFSNTIQYLKESSTIINDTIQQLKEKVITQTKNGLEIDINKINSLNNPKSYLYEILKEYGFTEYDNVKTLLSAQSGKQLYTKNYRLIKNRETFLLTKIKEGNDFKNENILIDIQEDTAEILNPIHLQFTIQKNINYKVHNTSKKEVHLNKELLKFPLIVRKWQKGDYFYPLGMHGKKKVSKFFKDEKLSILEKENTWLLCNKKDIVWVIGKRLDDRYKITNPLLPSIKIELKQ